MSNLMEDMDKRFELFKNQLNDMHIEEGELRSWLCRCFGFCEIFFSIKQDKLTLPEALKLISEFCILEHDAR